MADLKTDERLYFLSESEIHDAEAGMNEEGSGHADEEHVLVGRFICMH